MDTITHTLTGLALGQAGLKRKTRFAVLALVIGSNLPDIDIISLTGGSLNYLKDHRGITHSLIGFTVLAALWAFLIYAFGRRARPARRGPALNAKWLFFICWIAAGCHILMDYTNPYGVRLLFPWSGRWFAEDVMPIVDVWALLFLVIGLAGPALLRLVSEEVGAARDDPSIARKGAIFALCGIIAVWGVRDLAHRRALGMLSARIYRGQEPVRIGAFPTLANPFQWDAVVQTDSFYFLVPVDTLSGGVNPYEWKVLYKASPSPALTAATETRAARIFLNFARFPQSLVNETENGFNVYFRDLRFASVGSERWNFVLVLRLSRNLRLQKQRFSFTRRPPER